MNKKRIVMLLLCALLMFTAGCRGMSDIPTEPTKQDVVPEVPEGPLQGNTGDSGGETPFDPEPQPTDGPTEDATEPDTTQKPTDPPAEETEKPGSSTQTSVTATKKPIEGTIEPDTTEAPEDLTEPSNPTEGSTESEETEDEQVPANTETGWGPIQ